MAEINGLLNRPTTKFRCVGSNPTLTANYWKLTMKLELLVLIEPEVPEDFLVWDFDQFGFVVLLEI